MAGESSLRWTLREATRRTWGGTASKGTYPVQSPNGKEELGCLRDRRCRAIGARAAREGKRWGQRVGKGLHEVGHAAFYRHYKELLWLLDVLILIATGQMWQLRLKRGQVACPKSQRLELGVPTFSCYSCQGNRKIGVCCGMLHKESFLARHSTA